MSGPCPQTPSRPAWWRQQFARRPGTPCMAELAFVLGCRMAGAASCRCCAAGSAFPSPRTSLLSAGALSCGLWGNPAGDGAFRTRFVARPGSVLAPVAAQRPPEPINQGAGVNCGAIIRNELRGDGTAGPAGSLAQPEPWEAWPGHSRSGTLAKPGASPSPAGAVQGTGP